MQSNIMEINRNNINKLTDFFMIYALGLKINKYLCRNMRHRHSHIVATRRQKTFAWIILCVYVPMILLASLHVHTINESVVVDCHDCHTAVHHSGHFTPSQSHHGDCLSCRFLTTLVDTPKDAVNFLIKQSVSKIDFHKATAPVVAMVAHPSLRAPPFIL